MLVKQCCNFLISAVINGGPPSAILHCGVSSVAQQQLHHTEVINDDGVVEGSESRVADKMVDEGAELMIPHCSNYNTRVSIIDDQYCMCMQRVNMYMYMYSSELAYNHV